MTCLRLLSLIPIAAGLGLALTGAPARACGGTFCDGPQNLPVDQTGENILFVLAGDHTEAHIQIQYDPNTEANKFAWLVPVTAVPEFTVGSQQLFLNLLNGTVPGFGFTQNVEPCGYDSGYDSCGETSGAGSTSDGTSGDGTTTDGDPPDVLLRTTVGAFDIVVLQGGDAKTVMEWLGQAGYYQDPDAAPILQEYIDDGYLFAALKLTQNAGVDEIHPITLTYPGNEPCVPIKLTRIAAKQDMDIRTFFLGEHRVGPSNYHHVVPNDARFDWPNFAMNYKEIISLAVDTAPANGHGFVTEFAGDSAVVDPSGLFSDAWVSAPFADAKAPTVIDLLSAQGLIECANDLCIYNHPLIQGILGQYLPVPDGLTDGEFYSCLTCYEGLIDVGAYDSIAFAAAVEERIILPGAHAVELLAAWPTVTRLYTTLSPEEMTEDPFFYQNPDLPDVDLRAQTATWNITCRAVDSWDLPSGRSVHTSFSWPAFPEEMPYAERIEVIPPAGPPQVEADFGEIIDMVLEKFNISVPFPQTGCETTGATTDTTSGGTTGGTTDTAGTAGTEGGTGTGGVDTDTGGTDESATASGGGLDDEGSCACRSDGGDPAAALLILGLGGALGAGRRRRRG
ncbi:MAG: DUF2330 domain-containing protein [Nannocystaceae bacterium]